MSDALGTYDRDVRKERMAAGGWQRDVTRLLVPTRTTDAKQERPPTGDHIERQLRVATFFIELKRLCQTLEYGRRDSSASKLGINWNQHTQEAIGRVGAHCAGASSEDSLLARPTMYLQQQ